MKYWAGPIFTAKPSYIILSTPICQQPNVDHADAKHGEFWKLTMHCSRSGRKCNTILEMYHLQRGL